MAVTGPFYDGIFIKGVVRRKIWYRQTVPFRKPLHYHHSLYRGWYSDSVTGEVRTPSTFLSSPTFLRLDGAGMDSTSDEAYLRAYDSLVNNMSKDEGSASMGVTVAEARSSWTMINDRLNRLVRFGGLLRAGPRALPEVVSTLLLNERNASRMRRSWPSRKAVARDFASSYLELIFGWIPLVKDIQDAINVLQNPPSRTRIRGKGVEKVHNRTSDTPGWLPPQGWLRYEDKYEISRVVQCNVRISNPNLDLANRLGFVNLPAIGWELVPGSFLLDWFVPVGRFFESYTDFVGREVSDISMSVKCVSSSTTDANYAGAGGRGLELSENSGTGFYRYPLVDIPTPTRFRGFTLPTRGLQSRAITLFALFTQSFAK